MRPSDLPRLPASPTAPARLNGALREFGLGILVMAALVAVHVPLGLGAFFHWKITNGVLFAALWCMPRRWWPWLFAGTILARTLTSAFISANSGDPGVFLHYWPGPVQFVLANVLEPVLLATGVVLLQQWRVSPREPMSLDSMTRIHIATALSALAVVSKDLAYVLVDGRIGDVRLDRIIDMEPLVGPSLGAMLAAFMLKNFLGNFIGFILIVPFGAWICEPAHYSPSKPIIKSAIRYLLPTMALYLVLSLSRPGSNLGELLRLLLMVAVVVFAMRHGWRGAAVSVLVASIAIAVEEHVGLPVYTPLRLQMFIAITGSMALLFGVTVDDMRRSTALLRQANAEAAALTTKLHASALRNLQAEERERRRLAADLHDEFGQNLTALQTHLKLAQRDFVASGRTAVVDNLLELTRNMRRNIGAVLESLRPAALDELGLYASIERGQIRRLVEEAGLEFDAHLEGDARLLSMLAPVHRHAAYRVVQEAVTNVVRHARASRCEVRLRINLRNDAIWLFIHVRDDGVGGVDGMRANNGLTNIFDRVVALSGSLKLADMHPGLRVHALIRQPFAEFE
ncbi:histidine kinase [Lysobacter sp. GCM10012299]|uniref:histidine kinase n=1 Tax=Lysobacter sp. GCM10012299 TaxID=3317333 RepID=UPI00360F3F91